MNRGLAGLLVVLALPAPASAQHRVRIATVAPERSGWAHELQAYARAVDRATEGRVRLKFYWGGVAGNELEIGERIRKGQLDGTASGGMMCADVMPSMRIFRIKGMFQSRAEATYVTGQLSDTLRGEARARGFELLGISGLGATLLFSRKPIANLKHLRTIRHWQWSLDRVGLAVSTRMGLQPVPLAIADGRREFEAGRIDAFYAIPTAALAFQWFALAPHVTQLPGDFLTGCVLITARAFDRLEPDDRTALRRESAKVTRRIEAVGKKTEDALLGGVFAGQGVRYHMPSKQFRLRFLDAARRARDELPESVVPRALVRKGLRMLGDYRAVRGAPP